MAEDHERIEELLAGYAVMSLSGEDAIEANRLLAEHVPSCPMCRDTLAGFQAVAAELGFAATPVAPPDLLLPGIRHELGASRRVRRHLGSSVAIAAGVAALVGMAALSMSLGTRATRAESHLQRLSSFVDAVARSGAAPVRLDSATASGPRMIEVSGPSLEQMIVTGQGIPQPGPNAEYVLWLGSDAGYRAVRGFVPDERGFVWVRFAVDPAPFDRILITEERQGAWPDRPTTSAPHVWQASL